MKKTRVSQKKSRKQRKTFKNKKKQKTTKIMIRKKTSPASCPPHSPKRKVLSQTLFFFVFFGFCPFPLWRVLPLEDCIQWVNPVLHSTHSIHCCIWKTYFIQISTPCNCCPNPFSVVSYVPMVPIKYCNITINATTLCWMTSHTVGKYKVLPFFSILNGWISLVFTFFSFKTLLWTNTISYWKLPLKTQLFT